MASADAKAEGTASPSASGLATRASTTSVLSLSDDFGETTKKAGGFYRIRYRILGTDEWSSVDTDQLTAGIKGLWAGKTYEIEISKVCASGIVPSPIFQVTVPKLPRRLPQECGSEPSTEGFEETPIDELFVNDTIIAAGAYVRITNVVGGPAGWTGEGEVAIPFLPKSRVAVEFSNIVVNVNYELIAGYIETVYDDKMSNVVNLDAISGLFDNGPSIEQVNYAIPIDTIMQGPGGIIIVVRSDGGIDSFKAPIIVIAPGLEAVLVNGYQFEVFDMDDMVDSIAPEQFTFMAHPEQKYGFDGVKKELLTEYKEEAGFVMPYKSVAFGEADKIKAVLTGDPPNDADVHFVELSTAADLKFTRSGNEYDIITGGLKSGLSQVIALGPNGIMGMFQVMGTAKEFVTVHLVPLNGYGKNTDAQSIEKAATDILRQAGFSVRVDVLDVGLQYGGAKISLENHFASAYSPDMKQIISQLGRKVNKEAHDVYMILTDKMEGNTTGFMPKGMGIGFMELGGGGQTLAHELCHGLFNMPHIFEGFYEGKTKGSLPDNLMDYNEGTALYYRQWARMQSPGVHLAWFDDEREGKYDRISGAENIKAMFEKFGDKKYGTLSFYKYSGELITFKADSLESVTFTTGENYSLESEFRLAPMGAISEASYGGKQVFADYDNHKVSYDDILTSEVKPAKGVVSYNCEEGGRISAKVFEVDKAEVSGDGFDKLIYPYLNQLVFKNSDNSLLVEAELALTQNEVSKGYFELRKDYFSCQSYLSPYVLVVGTILSNYPELYSSCVDDGKYLIPPFETQNFESIHQLPEEGYSYAAYDLGGLANNQKVAALSHLYTDLTQRREAVKQIIENINSIWDGKTGRQIADLGPEKQDELLEKLRKMSECQIQSLEFDLNTSYNLIKAILRDLNLQWDNKMEGLVNKLINSLKPDDIDPFFDYLETDKFEFKNSSRVAGSSNQMFYWQRLLSFVDDSYGDDNGKDLCKTLISKFNAHSTRLQGYTQSFPSLNLSGIIRGDEIAESSMKILHWQYDNIIKRAFALGNNLTPTYVNSAKINGDGTIDLTLAINIGLDSKTYVLADHIRPFDPIMMSKSSSFGVSRDLVDGEFVVVPGLVLIYLDKKATNQTVEDVVFTAIDLMSLAVPPAKAVTTLSKALHYSNQLSSVTSMAGTYYRDDNPKIAQVLNLVSTTLGFADITESFASRVAKGSANRKMPDIDLDVIENAQEQAIAIDAFSEGVISSKPPSGSLDEVLDLVEEEADYVKAHGGNYNEARFEEAVKFLRQGARSLEDLGEWAMKLKAQGVSEQKIFEIFEILASNQESFNNLAKSIVEAGLQEGNAARLVDDLLSKEGGDLLEWLVKEGGVSGLEAWKVLVDLPEGVRLNPKILEEVSQLATKKLNGNPLDIKKLIDNGFGFILKNIDEATAIARLQKLNQWDPKLVDDLARRLGDNKYAGLADDLVDNDIFDVYERLVLDPLNARDLVKHLDLKDGVLDKVGNSAFFVEVTSLGKAFENVVSEAVSSGVWRTKLKDVLSSKFGVSDLDSYEMFEQVQFLYNSTGTYFVADQVFVKFKTVAGQKVIDDIIILENKLSVATKLTSDQSSAKAVLNYTTRGTKLGVPAGSAASFNGGISKWVRAYGDGSGSTILDITDTFN